MGIGPREGVFWGRIWARHCNQWGLYGVRVRQSRDAALFPNYFGQTCYYSSHQQTTVKIQLYVHTVQKHSKVESFLITFIHHECLPTIPFVMNKGDLNDFTFERFPLTIGSPFLIPAFCFCAILSCPDCELSTCY